MATIGMILEHDYPKDLRVEKEALACDAAGHRVSLLALEFRGRPARETVGTVDVHRRALPRVWFNKLHPTILRWRPYRAWWSRRVRAFIREARPDVLVVHDLPLARSGLEEGRRAGIPVILDFHENFPGAIEGWGFESGVFGRYFYDLTHWRRYEEASARAADGVVVVVDEGLERLDGYGIPRDRTAVITNAEWPDFGSGVPRRDPGEDPPLTLLYIGGFGPHRGLDTAIEAIDRLDDGVASLRLVGAGRIRPKLEAQAARLRHPERVTFGDWVPDEKVPIEIAGAHVGLVPHVSSPHTETTVPHKLFQYMLLARPVITSDCAPLARIVKSTGCGVSFASGDAGALAGAIDTLARDASFRRRCAEAGEAAARDELSWPTEGRRLVAFYERVIRRHREGTTAARRGPSA